MTDPLFGSAGAAAQLLRRREISSRELTELLLARIDSVNPRINAVVELDRTGALAAAAAADEMTAHGGDLGPLHGVPMTVKDAFDVTGLHTTWGNPAFRDHRAVADTAVVHRLRRAGAIIVGKSNVHFMLADFGQSANELYGRTNNPWDVGRTPGGSTGGGAAALAAGLSFLEYGSDLVGSIRIPAAFCGVYGLKPTATIVPLDGFQPPGPPAVISPLAAQTVLGPLARCADDLRTALVATAGPSSPAGLAIHWALPAPRHRRLADFRVGVVLDDPNAPVAGDVAAILSAAVDALARAGAQIVPGWPDGVDAGRVHEAFGFQIGLFFAFHEPADGGPPEPFATLPELFRRERERLDCCAAWDRYFEQVDVLLCPATFTTAFPHDDRPFAERTIDTPEGPRPYAAQSFWIAPASLAGLPAVSAPAGRTVAGLPAGLQIIGPRYEDDTAITFAALLADVAGGYQPPPS